MSYGKELDKILHRLYDIDVKTKCELEDNRGRIEVTLTFTPKEYNTMTPSEEKVESIVFCLNKTKELYFLSWTNNFIILPYLGESNQSFRYYLGDLVQNIGYQEYLKCKESSSHK